MLLNTAVKQ